MASQTVERGNSSGPVGPYMLQDLVDDLPLDTPENEDVEITYVEARGVASCKRLSMVPQEFADPGFQLRGESVLRDIRS